MILDRRPSFFSIIFSGHSNDRLRLPRHFMHCVSMEMYDKAILNGPSGSQCQVKLQKAPGNTYLEDGWQQFMRDHSLGDNEFLIFTYNGDMSFEVQIFEKSGCERVTAFANIKHQDSACKPIGYGESQRPRKFHPEPDASHICRQTISLIPGETSNPRECGVVVKKETAKQVNHTDKVLEIKSTANKLQHMKIKETTFKMGTLKRPHLPALKMKLPSVSNRLIPLAKNSKSNSKAEEFSSGKPHFRSYMTVHKTKRIFVLHVPASFARANLPPSDGNITLRNSEGETWNVRFTYFKGRHTLCKGWKSFALHNKVKDGDVCVFELVKKDLLRVHIFKSPHKQPTVA